MFLIYSSYGTNVYSSKGREFEGAWGSKLQNHVPRRALPIHLFRHFCCRMYRLATTFQTNRWTDRQTDNITMPSTIS